MNKTRLEAFSDGVIAIIITIMVLEIKVPESTDWEEIKSLIPKGISYILSFLFVAIYWGNHHHLLDTAKKITSFIIWANMNLLFWLSLIPFATAWIGENHFEKITVAVYAIIALACGIAYSILQYAIEKSYLHNSQLKTIIKKQKSKGIISIIAYVSAIPIALYINPILSISIFFVISIIWIIPDKNIEKALSKNDNFE